MERLLSRSRGSGKTCAKMWCARRSIGGRFVQDSQCQFVVWLDSDAYFVTSEALEGAFTHTHTHRHGVSV
eukprot:2673053-Amphidinium_carterae.1